MLVATERFRDAARHQARALGFEPAVVWVAHPIQNRTPAELERLARETAAPVLAALGGAPPSPRQPSRPTRPQTR